MSRTCVSRWLMLVWMALVACGLSSARGADAGVGFIREWLVSGPYPSYQVNGEGRGLDTDFLGGEGEARPYPGLKATGVFEADKGKLIAGIGSTNEWGFRETRSLDATWRVIAFPSDLCEPNDQFGPIKDYFVYYATCYVEVPAQTEAMLRVGSDDDHKLFLNGVQVGRQASSQGIVRDNFLYPVTLEPGTNAILLKVVDRLYGTGHCLAVTDRKGKAIPGLKAHAEHPGRRLGQRLYGNGCAATITFADSLLLEGAREAAVSLTKPEGVVAVRLNGRPVEDGGRLTLELKEGRQPLTLEFLAADGSVRATLRDWAKVYAEERLRQEGVELERRLAALRSELPRQREAVSRLERGVAEAETRLSQAYGEVERRYAAERARHAATAPKSVDEPLPAATRRSLLCVNGLWEASTDRKDWHEVLVPMRMMNRYFLSWTLPVRPREPGKVYGEYDVLPGFEDFRLSPVTTAKRAYFRREFDFDGEGTVQFVAECIQGKATYFCNGLKVGEYDGIIGVQRVELTNLVVGRNVFELEFEVGRHNQRYGILGDVYFEYVPEVRVDDLYVRPSWRRASLAVETEMVNRTRLLQRATVRQYAVRDGRIRLRLPEREVSLPSGQRIRLENVSGWADPLVWGIGGDYGNPDLYELVTDIWVGDRLVDRHRQTFGFREFWIWHTDFFLNGRRILLQGDTGHGGLNEQRFRDIFWPLLRADGINTLRQHDSDYWSVSGVQAADRMGMLFYLQMYPALHEPNARKPLEKHFSPVETWPQTDTHRWNLDNYERWFRTFRNSPSVVIWSTDNEVLTQAWDTADKAPFNIRNDRIAALYEKYMKTLDEGLVMTRDGDVGTHNSKARWYENPPCDTATYHYPDFNLNQWVIDWQRVYEYRPAIFGETLYFSYGAWDGWIGAIPTQVAKKAQRVREVGALYRRLGIPGQIYMGLSTDGFIQWDDTGKGNPWGLASSVMEACAKDGTRPQGRKPDEYPYFRIQWPALSGRGERSVGLRIDSKVHNSSTCNWFDERYPSHVRNAVNDAYRDTLIPQPPLRAGTDAECIVETAPGADVWCVRDDGERVGVRADAQGRAWFQLERPGTYVFTGDGETMTVELGDRTAYVARPGFGQIRRLRLGGAAR